MGIWDKVRIVEMPFSAADIKFCPTKYSIPLTVTTTGNGATFTMTIQDSGERVEHPSGAVRDTDEGKVRWSLFPPELWYLHLSYDTGFWWQYLKDGNPHSLMKGLWNYFRQEDLSRDVMANFSAHMDGGAEKYSPYNWARGFKVTRCIDSAGRHLEALSNGSIDEDHYSAFLCNAMFCAWIGIHHPSLNDFPGWASFYEEAQDE